MTDLDERLEAIATWADDPGCECSRVICPHIAEKVATMVRDYAREQVEARGYLQSCPWCGVDTSDWVYTRCASHLIEHGDKYRAHLAASQDKAEMFQHANVLLAEKCLDSPAFGDVNAAS